MDNSIGMTRHTLQSQSVQMLLSSNAHFDVIIIEAFFNDALLGLGYHFKAPVVAFSPLGATKITNDMVGSPAPIEYVPHVTLSYTDQMTIAQRMVNTLTAVAEYIFVEWVYLPTHQQLLTEFFGPNTPPLTVLQTNVSLVLLNTHFTLNYPRPYMTNMIEVGGLHIKSERSASKLSSRLQRFLDEATDGVIYFSMGSIIRSSEMSQEKFHAFHNVFKSLRQRVLWKFDSNENTEIAPNVMISKWFPQEAVLAHRNVRLFITHGGLLSCMEAVYFGVPFIGVPIYGDQHLNLAKAVAAGYGLLLQFDNITETSLTWAVKEILSNIR